MQRRSFLASLVALAAAWLTPRWFKAQPAPRYPTWAPTTTTHVTAEQATSRYVRGIVTKIDLSRSYYEVAIPDHSDRRGLMRYEVALQERERRRGRPLEVGDVVGVHLPSGMVVI